MLQYLKHLMEVTLSPAQGWKDVGADTRSTRATERNGLFPWLGVVAASALIRYFYDPGLSAPFLFQSVLITFGMYFVGYYIAILSMSVLSERFMASPDIAAEHRIRILTAYCTGMLALFTLIENVLPSHLTLLHFLPFYVGIVIWRGIDYVGVNKDHTGVFMVVAIISIIAPPYLVGMMMGCII